MSARNKWYRLGLHLLFVLGYFLYETINAAWSAEDRFDFSQIHKVWATIPIMILAVYVNLYVLMPRFLYRKRYAEYFLSLVVLLFIWGILTRFMAYQFWLPWDKKNYPWQYATEPKEFFVPIRIARNALRLYPTLALTMAIKLLRNSYNKEKQLRLAERERHLAEMQNLRAQIHPHFFFNTLNSLYSLTLTKSEKAPELVLRLSGLMHYMLYEASAESIPLEDEIRHLKDFIAVELIRFGDRLECSFQVSGDISGKWISPLLLLPLVENAFKHSKTEESTAWVVLVLKVLENRLFFAVENSTGGEESGSKPGIGLMNVKRRLELLYNDRHELTLNREEHIFKAQLNLELDG